MPVTDLSFLFDVNPNPIWIFELSTLRILKVNKAAIDKYGHTEHEFLNMTTRELRPPGDVEGFESYLRRMGITDAKVKGLTQSGTWKHQNKKGDVIYAEITSKDVLFEGIDCRIVVAADVTEKIQSLRDAELREQELVWTKNSLEALINNTEDQVWSLDREKRYVCMNSAYRKQIKGLTGAEPAEGEYAAMHTGYSEAIIETWDAYYGRALAGERYTIVDESIDPLTMEVLSFEVNFNPIYKTKDEITGVGCFARNITERLKTEKAIVDQNDRLRHIASLTSHELRRPVASMLGLINIMDRSNFFNPDNREIIEHLLTVGNEIDEVIRLIVDKTFIGDTSTDKYQIP